MCWCFSMSDLTAMLERQAAWQRARAEMTWTEKLRLALMLRSVAVALRASGKQDARKVAEGPSEYGAMRNVARREGKSGG